MKYLLPLCALVLSFLVPVFGQKTTITDTLYTGTGALAKGTVYITPSQQFTTSGGIVVTPVTTTLQISNGHLTVQLYPNDSTSSPPSTGCPSICTTYTARYSLTNQAGPQLVETWLVITSATAVPLSAVRTSPPPLPAPTVSLSQVTSGGGVPGQCPVLSSGLIWVPGTCGSGGGGGAPTNATYLTRQSEAGLSAEFSLGSLASGLLKQTVAAGLSTPAIAVPGTDYVLPTGSITGNAATASSLDHDPAGCPAGQPVSDVSPTVVLTCTALTAAQVTNAFDKSTSNNVSTGTQDFSLATHVLPAPKGTTLPATCTVGEFYFKTDATAGQNIYLCTATNTWTQTTGGGSGGGGTLTSINSDSTPAQTLTKTDDTNVTLTIVNNGSGDHKFNLGFTGTISAGRLNANVVQSVTNDTNVTGSITAQVLTLGWTGTLSKARQFSSTIYNDQANTYGAFLQDVSAGTFKLPVSAGATTATNGLIAYDSTANMLHAAQSGADAKIPQFTVTPVNGTCATWVVAGTTYKLGSASCSGASGLADPGANGILSRTALNVTTARTLTGTAGNITITNGDGVSGNPTINLGTTPALGTPASGVMTNVTGLPISTGVSGLAAGIAAFLATPTSLNFFTAITDETGSGSIVGATGATLISVNLGTPASGVMTNVTGLPVSTGISGLGTGVATALALPASGTGSICLTTGSGCAAGVSGLTTGKIPKAASAISLADSIMTESSGLISVAGNLATGDGTVAGEDALYELVANGTNYRSWFVPNALSADLRLEFPNTTPSADAVMLFPAPSSSISQFAWTSIPACADTSGNHLNFTASAFSCGTSSSSSISGLTTGVIPKAASSTTLTNSIMTESTGLITVAGNLATGDGTVAGEDALYELTANGFNYRSWFVPDSLMADLRLEFPNTLPAADALMLFPAPSSSISQFSWISIPACADSGGNHLNFASSTFSCGTSGGGGGSTSFTPVAAMFTDQRVIGSQSAALDFPSTGNGLCSVLIFTFYGAQPDDTAPVKRPPALADGWQVTAWVDTYDTVKVQACNMTGSTADPGPFSYGISLIR